MKALNTLYRNILVLSVFVLCGFSHNEIQSKYGIPNFLDSDFELFESCFRYDKFRYNELSEEERESEERFEEMDKPGITKIICMVGEDCETTYKQQLELERREKEQYKIKQLLEQQKAKNDCKAIVRSNKLPKASFCSISSNMKACAAIVHILADNKLSDKVPYYEAMVNTEIPKDIANDLADGRDTYLVLLFALMRTNNVLTGWYYPFYDKDFDRGVKSIEYVKKYIYYETKQPPYMATKYEDLFDDSDLNFAPDCDKEIFSRYGVAEICKDSISHQYGFSEINYRYVAPETIETLAKPITREWSMYYASDCTLVTLAILYENGIGVKQDKNKATSYYKRVCENAFYVDEYAYEDRFYEEYEEDDEETKQAKKQLREERDKAEEERKKEVEQCTNKYYEKYEKIKHIKGI